MNDQIKKKVHNLINNSNFWGYLLIIAAFLANCYIIVRGNRNFIHSDGASVILFAREQMLQNKVFPDGWWYGTYLWNFELNTFMIPLFRFFTRWVDVRAGAVIIQTGLMISVMLGFKKINIINKKSWIVILLMLLPVSEVVSEHWYFQATYMILIIFLALMIFLTFLLLNKSKKQSILFGIVLITLLCLRISMSYMMVLVFALPMMATMLVQCILEYHETQKINAVIKNYVFICLVIFIGVLAGIIYNSYLIDHLNFIGNGASEYSFSPYREINLDYLLQGFMRLFGAADQSSNLLSLSGILKALGFVYMLIMLFIIPILLYRNYNNIKHLFQKICLIFTSLSTIAVIYIFVITGMDQGRYLLWIYFYTIILLGIFVDNFDVIEISFKKEFKIIFILFFTVFVCTTYFYYIDYDYKNNPDSLGVNNDKSYYKTDHELIDYMLNNNYKYGFAPYWTAYSSHVLSDGKVSLSALELDWTGPYLWLASENWFKYEYYQNECFILIGDDMMENLPDIYKEQAIRNTKFKNNNFYFYENIKTLENIWQVLKETDN